MTVIHDAIRAATEYLTEHPAEAPSGRPTAAHGSLGHCPLRR
jgi:hypothetical protein